jgi:anti-sigma regulatory factor (Ser/Thr protein kinase)
MGGKNLTRIGDMATIPRKGQLLFQSIFFTSFESRIAAIESAKKALGERNLKVTLTDFEFFLILDEAITNALEHGNGWDGKKKFTVELRQGKYVIYFYVQDEGKGFDTKVIPEIIRKKFKLSPRGRGIYIMANYSRAFWNVKGNELCLCIRLKK